MAKAIAEMDEAEARQYESDLWATYYAAFPLKTRGDVVNLRRILTLIHHVQHRRVELRNMENSLCSGT